jgi:DNA-binding NarL/FixJ family response regulator
LDKINEELRVLIADDHALMRSGLSLLIKKIDKKIVFFETSNLAETVDRLNNVEQLDILLLDLSMPGMEGISSAKYICETWPEVPIIVISVEEGFRSIRSALSCGVMGYIPKSSTPNVTLSAIQMVLSGGIYVPPHLLLEGLTSSQDIILEASGAEPNERVRRRKKFFGLTSRQEDVLNLLSYGKSNKNIASQLGLMPGTVKMHIARIFKILSVSNRTEAVIKYEKLKEKRPEGKEDNLVGDNN